MIIRSWSSVLCRPIWRVTTDELPSVLEQARVEGVARIELEVEDPTPYLELGFQMDPFVHLRRSSGGEPVKDVRRATPSDLDLIIPLFDAYRVFYGRESDVALARQFLETPKESLLWITSDGSGFAQVYPSQDLHDGGPLWILNDLYVTPEVRRRGLATALLRQVASEAPCSLTLKTMPDNPALQLYRREGYLEEAWNFLYYSVT